MKRKQREITLLGESIKIFERNTVDALASDEVLGRRKLGHAQFIQLHVEIIWDSIKRNWEGLDEIKWFNIIQWYKARELRKLRSKYSTRNLIRKLTIMEIFAVVREIYFLETGERRDYLEVSLGNMSREEALKRSKSSKKKDLSLNAKQSKH